jgi:DNA-binding transcriptional LysR family regulator
MNSSDQLEALRERKIDLAFPRLFFQPLDGLEHKIIVKEKYCLAINKSHPLSKRRKIPLSVLKNEPLILISHNLYPLLHERLLFLCQNNGYNPAKIQEANGKSTTLSLVGAGLGIAFVPESFCTIKRTNVTYLKINNKLPTVELAAAWRDNFDSPLVNSLLEISLKSVNK